MSLVGHWKFDESSGLIAADSSGSGNNGSLINMSGDSSEWVPGPVNNALYFDSANANVNCGNVTEVDGLAAISISLWYKAVIPFGNLKALIGKNNGSLSGPFTLSINWDAKPKWTLGNVTTISGGTQAITLNTWHHVVMTYDGSNLRTYIDKVNSATKAGTGSLFSTSDNLFIGNDYSLTNSADGILDDVRIYDKALDQTEIDDLFNPTGPQLVISRQRIPNYIVT